MYSLRIFCLAGLIVAAGLLTGCATSKEVREIVDESNSVIIVASMGGQGEIMVADPPSAPGTDDWQKEVERIERFISSNPDQVATNNALRIREAVLLLNAGKPNLARAVFAEVECSELGNSRDRAICDAQEPLVWWYGLATTLSEKQRSEAKEAIVEIGAVADDLERTSPTRRMLEQIRVRAAIRLAESLSHPDDVKAVLSEALTRYAKQFSEAEHEIIQDWGMSGELPVALLPSLRWYNYVPKVFEQADKINDAICGVQCPDYTPAWVACIADKSCS